MPKPFHLIYLLTTKRILATLAIISLTVLLPLGARALPSDAKQPIKLLADRATYNETTGVTSYSGEVTITQGTLKLEADNITINLSDSRTIETAVASGHPATMQQIITAEKGLAKGQANTIDYNAVSGIMTLTGNAKLTQNGASFSGNVIRYSLAKGDIEAMAGNSQRVELVFPPSDLSNRQGIR